MEQLLLFVALAFSPANVLPTALLVLALVYWLIVLVGLLDMNALDGPDVGHDADAGDGGDADHDGDAGALKAVFGFIGGVETPAAITLTVFALVWWATSLTVTSLLGISSFLWGLVVFVPAALGSAVVTKVVTWPLRALFRSLGKQTEQFEEIMGREGTVITGTVDGTFGQVRIETGGAPITLNARTEHGEVIDRDAEVIVVGYDKKSGIAIVHKP